jgi:hypothetical protein
VNSVNLGKKIGLFLRAEMIRKNITSKKLCDKLALLGVVETPQNINNKISRGTFSAAFFIQCLKAIGYENCDIAQKVIEHTDSSD